jgi:hypothetical protein
MSSLDQQQETKEKKDKEELTESSAIERKKARLAARGKMKTRI